MKPKSLNLRIKYLSVNDLAKSSANMIIQGLTTKEQIVGSKEEALGIIFDLVQEIVDNEVNPIIKSACEFYLKYEDNPDLLFEDAFDITKNSDDFVQIKLDAERWIDKVKKDKERYNEYNEWLFKLTFKDVLKKTEGNV